MSTKPTVGQIPTWDTGLVNTIALTAGHKTSGFANSEIPTSAEINMLFSLMYLWCQYISDGDLTGNITTTSTAESANAALIQFRDWKLQARTTIDHLGYRGGQVTEWEEHWRTAGTAAPTGWTYTSNAGGAGTITDPSATFGQRYVALSTTAGLAGDFMTGTTEYLGWMDNSSVIVEEFTFQTTAVNGAGLSNSRIGIQFSGNAGADFAVIAGVSGTANLQAYTIVNNVAGATDTGVAYTANTKYRIRIECLGSNNTSQAAGTFQFRFYINGALVATRNQATIVAAKFRPHMKATTTAASFIDPVNIGRIRMMFNHVLASDAI